MSDLEALVAQVPDEVLEYIEALEGRVEELTAVEKAAAPAPTDDIEKALTELPEGLADLFKAQKAELEETRQALEAERVAKAEAEWVEKAAALEGVIDNTEEFGAKLRALSEVDSELADSIVSALSAASERVAKADLFVEKGHRGGAPTSAEEKIEQIAKSLVEANPAKTLETARSEAWESNPELYDEYTNEKQQIAAKGA